mmetsp:Transcript_17939/g.37579  ORF Transcript_17939/g.37579 Transcript_17939/m.37579 type:complete len:89 (+) Transcript_17939:161-427(+)
MYLSLLNATDCIDTLLPEIVRVLASTAWLTSIHIRSFVASHGGRHRHARKNRESTCGRNYENVEKVQHKPGFTVDVLVLIVGYVYYHR